MLYDNTPFYAKGGTVISENPLALESKRAPEKLGGVKAASSHSQPENATGRETATELALRASELSYRRLFEAAQDGILILEVETGRITDVNPFLVKLLGFSRGEMVGQTVGELSPFKDIVSNRAMLERLQKDGYVRH